MLFSEINQSQRLGQVLGHVQSGELLTRNDAAELLLELLNTETSTSDAFWIAIFAAIQARGADETEILGFVDAVCSYDKSLRPENANKRQIISRSINSVAGSGKDSWKTFNISTTASFIAAARGVSIFKPSSRALSSVTGATDLVHHLDLPELVEIDQAGELLEREGLAFLDYSKCVPRYAKRYSGRFFQFHPLSYVMPVIAIPFQLDGVVFGIADRRTEFCRDLMNHYGFKSCAAVTTRLDACQVTDELLPFGKARFSLLREGIQTTSILDYTAFEDVSCIAHQGSHEANAKLVLETLQIREETPAAKAASMAAASILVTAGAAESLEAGYRESLEAILDGSAMDALNRYREGARRVTRTLSGIGPSAHAPANLVKAAEDAQRQISSIAETYNYEALADAQKSLRGVARDHLLTRFTHHDALERFDEVATEEQAIITGFGPTSAPTAGTLSVMLKVIGLQARIGCSAEIIVSDLGAFLSRKKEWSKLQRLTQIFERFISVLAGERNNIVVRTHIDKGNLGLASFINEELLDTETFLENKEATELLYEHLGLLGSRLGIITDATYTVSDIIKPFFPPDFALSTINSKRRVLVIAGLEEHYFPRLASIALERLNARFGGRFTAPDSAVSALYTRIIPGFAPYPKMSKSIPDSGLSLEDSPDDIYRKIVDATEVNQSAVFETITQASDWGDDLLSEALVAFSTRFTNHKHWRMITMKYADDFLGYSRAWAAAKASIDDK
jgi:anthranilate phosphoribosyltransferase